MATCYVDLQFLSIFVSVIHLLINSIQLKFWCLLFDLCYCPAGIFTFYKFQGELKANECLREEFGVERKISDIPDPEAFEAEIQMTTPMSPIVELGNEILAFA